MEDYRSHDANDEARDLVDACWESLPNGGRIRSVKGANNEKHNTTGWAAIAAKYQDETCNNTPN